MTAAEVARERAYIYTERLGMLCEDREPTSRDIEIANKTADEAVKDL